MPSLGTKIETGFRGLTESLLKPTANLKLNVNSVNRGCYLRFKN